MQRMNRLLEGVVLSLSSSVSGVSRVLLSVIQGQSASGSGDVLSAYTCVVTFQIAFLGFERLVFYVRTNC